MVGFLVNAPTVYQAAPELDIWFVFCLLMLASVLRIFGCVNLPR